MIAIIDIGSNSVRLNAYKTTSDGFKLLFSEKEMAGLASHIENNELSEAGLKNLLRILHRFRDVLDNLNIQVNHPFATASLRNITNSDEVLNKIEKETGFQIHLISGEDEGYLGYFGSKVNIKVDQGVVVDIGGGSTELVHFEHEVVDSSKSIPMGSLNLYKMFVSNILPNQAEQKALKKFAKESLKKGFNDIKVGKYSTIIGVGGTIRAVLKLENYMQNNYGSRIVSYKRLNEIIRKISDGSNEAQALILKVIPERIHTIIPGLLILKEVMKYFGCQEIIVSQTGAREGYLLKYVLKKEL